jgi:two-component system nitrogen regulation response regulator NtrX
MRKYGKLLIIDDEQEIGKVLCEIFENMFEKVIFCDNATEALGVTKATELSAILSDLSMPGLPGDELVRKLRANGNLTPIMLLTGHASKEAILTALRLGVSDVFEKPFDNDFLIASVDRVLEIEKRKRNIFSQLNSKKPNELEKEFKMLGLLQVVNETKKAS